MFLTENLKILQLPLRTSIAFVCTNALGQQPKPTNNRKEKIRILTSLLFFCLHSDMLTFVSVIFSLCEGDIKPYGFNDILFARKLAKQITLG